MAKKKTLTPKETQKKILASNIKDIEKRIKLGILRKPPKHRKFKVGERVSFGAHKECYIREKGEDGMYYIVECLNVSRERGMPPANEFHATMWHQLHKYEVKETNFTKEENFYIRQYNGSLSSLLHMIFYAGIDFEVEYQREHVWKTRDKVSLIDSIFNNIDIGKIVLVQLDYTHDIYYEVLDGKQRLSALRDFYEDRFKYNGYYYSELSRKDKNTFENHSIAYGYLDNPSKEAIFKTFIKLNTCGKPMARKHLDHVEKLLNEL